MNIAILSDAVLPAAWAFGGHGLGQMVAQVAEGLRAAGHEVSLYAKAGSQFSGRLVTAQAEGHEGEKTLAKLAYGDHKRHAFDVFLDAGHLHTLTRLFPALPVVNWHHDAFQEITGCSVVVSAIQRVMMQHGERARVIFNAVQDRGVYAAEPAIPGYALYLGTVIDYKQPGLAIEACARLQIPLVMAGIGADAVQAGPGVRRMSPVSGHDKWALIANARVLLQLGHSESFGLTTIEAGLCGTPVVAWPTGGNLDTVAYGVNGVFVPNLTGDRVGAVGDAIERAWNMDRATCRQYARKFADVGRQIREMETALRDCAAGRRW